METRMDISTEFTIDAQTNPPATLIPYSIKAVNDLLSIETQHIWEEKYPDLSCGCGCDRDEEEMADWTEDDLYMICLKCSSDNQLDEEYALDDSGFPKEPEYLGYESYFGEIVYPCKAILEARRTAAPETIVAVTLILKGSK